MKKVRKVSPTKTRHKQEKRILMRVSNNSRHGKKAREIKIRKGPSRTNNVKDPLETTLKLKKLKMFRQYSCLAHKRNAVAEKRENRL